MPFESLLLLAKRGSSAAMEELITMYRPLLLKESVVEGIFDEDLYQEFCIVLIRCVMHFDV